MALAFAQYPNRAMPLGSRPARSFVGRVTTTPIPEEPEIPIGRIRAGGHGSGWTVPIDELLEKQRVDTDDLEIILAVAAAFLEGELWRN